MRLRGLAKAIYDAIDEAETFTSRLIDSVRD